MPGRHPGNGPFGTVVGACFWLLAGAAAVYFAVHLILRVWIPLVIIGAVLLIVGITVHVVRTRRSGW